MTALWCKGDIESFTSLKWCSLSRTGEGSEGDDGAEDDDDEDTLEWRG
jgi:hypothetical protein